SAPTNLSYGGTFTLQSPDAASVTSAVLVRAGAVTHAFDMDQRLVGMAFSLADASNLTVTAPPNGNIAPPGFYLLFLVNSAGVPSIGKFVQLSAASDFTASDNPDRKSTRLNSSHLGISYAV